MPRALAVLMLFAAAGASAQQAPEVLATEAMKQLKTSKKVGIGPVADGSAVDNGNGTETVSVERNILLEENHLPARRTCTHDDAGVTDGPGSRRLSRTCESDPAHVDRKFGDRHHIRIKDREEYKSSQGKKWAGWGALIGGLIGALGFLTLLIPGVGIAAGIGIGIAAMAVGAGTGAVIGNAVARGDAGKQPENYTEDDVKWTETKY